MELTVFLLPVRIVQGLFSLIVLGTLAYTANAWSNLFFHHDAPSQVSFLIFVAVWTLLALAYFFLAPIFLPVAAHHFALLAVDAVTMIFWFAGFIALAAGLGDTWYGGCGDNGPCHSATAGDVFSAFEWLLFVFTTVVATMAAIKNRQTAQAPAAPAMSVP